MRSAPARACWPTANSAGEHPHRGDELHEVGGEGEERAEGDVAVDGQPAAEGQHRDLGEGGDAPAAPAVKRACSRTSAAPRARTGRWPRRPGGRARGPPGRSP